MTSAKQSKLADLPTVASSGLRNYESVVSYGVLGPAKIPRNIVNRLQQEIARAVHDPGLTEKFHLIGAEAIGSSPDDFAQLIKREIGTMGKVLREAGIAATPK